MLSKIASFASTRSFSCSVSATIWTRENWYEDAGRLEVRLAGGRGHLKVPVPKGLRPGNVAAAVQAMACVVSEDIDGGAVARALQDLTVPGRRERRNVLDRELVLDVAHNPAAMTALVEWLPRVE